jgi:hypothetical protein
LRMMNTPLARQCIADLANAAPGSPAAHAAKAAGQ